MRQPAGFPRTLALTATLALAALACPLDSSAQDIPSYATGGQETIHGTIASLSGRYALTLDDDRGFTDSVTLRDGTIIYPTDVSLEVGQSVTILGKTDGKTFDADEIDTDGADTSEGAPAGGYYIGPYTSDTYPPYVVSVGGGGFYYGSGFDGGGGYYYDNNAGSGNVGPSTGGTKHPPIRPHGPGGPPLVGSHALPPSHPSYTGSPGGAARSAPSAGHGSGSARR